MMGREGARRTLAVHPHVTELGVLLALYEIVTDLVDQFEVAAEDFAKGFGDLLEDDQSVDDGEVAARGDGVEVVAVVRRFRREVAEVYVGDVVGLFGASHLEVVSRQPVPPAPRACVRLYEQGTRLFAPLQFNEVVAAA